MHESKHPHHLVNNIYDLECNHCLNEIESMPWDSVIRRFGILNQETGE
jgi:hypothetical protein